MACGFRREVDDGPDLESWVDGGGDCRISDVEYFGHEVREPFEFRVFVGVSFAGFLPCLEHGVAKVRIAFSCPYASACWLVFFDERVGLGFFDDVGHWFLFLFYVDIFSITEKSQMSIKVAHRGYPRMCEVGAGSVCRCPSFTGLSPRVRGRFGLQYRQRRVPRFIPVCAR